MLQRKKLLKCYMKVINFKKNNIKIYQSPESRVIQTLKSKKHTMSMLYAYQNQKEIELKVLWKSF